MSVHELRINFRCCYWLWQSTS